MVDRDLPVAVALPPPLAGEVIAYVEGERGWQVVGLDGPPRPVLVLAEVPLAGRATVVVVDGETDAATVRAALHDGAIDVISWPRERAQLGEAAARAGSPPVVATNGPALLRVAGVAGGAGTSTVTLALAGLLAWSGRRVTVVGGDDLLRLAGLAPWRGPGAREVGLLDARDAGAEVAALSVPVPGVRGLRALGGSDRGPLPVSGWPADAVVADLGVAPEEACEVRCARPDAHLRRITGFEASDGDDVPGGRVAAGGGVAGGRVAAGAGAAVVLVGDGPLRPQAVRRVLGGEPAAWLPSSPRVALAGVRGRVPADLPGSWLEALRGALRRVRFRRQTG